jgi:peptidyl-prolyl cis-trans isomerase SurA
MKKNKLIVSLLCAFLCLNAFAQKYPDGIIDKTVAVVGNEMITIGQLEQEVSMMRAQGLSSGKNIRCEILEQMLVSKLFLMQARIDSLSVNQDMVENELSNRMAQVKTSLGGEKEVEDYFGKSLFKLRQEWRKSIEEQTLTQQMQGQVAQSVPDIIPQDVRTMIDTMDKSNLPLIPAKYQLSQICIYPDKEKANLAVKEKLLALRDRIIKGESFSTLARLYSKDPGSARKGGELGMASKSIFWPVFSDAAMSLKPGIVSQIVETPDGFHIIQVIEKKGDMFNARHILLKPEYTSEDMENAYKTLDSLRTEILSGAVTFSLAARFYSQDPATRTNGGQMSDPTTGSTYFEIDKLKPQDYAAIQYLKEGEISKPVESLDNEGRSGNTVYKILKIDKVLPAHPATYEHDYNLLSGMAKQQKSMDAINKFVDEKIVQTHIIIDPIFKDCPFERSELSNKIRK